MVEGKRKYIVISSGSLSDLEKFVNNHIEEGYIPLGGISIGRVTNSTIWAQAMVVSELASSNYVMNITNCLDRQVKADLEALQKIAGA